MQIKNSVVLMGFIELVDKFFFEEMSSYSFNSKKNFRAAINHFGYFIKKQDFDEQDILKYFNSPLYNKLEITSQNLYKRFLKKFLKWYGIPEEFLMKLKKKREIEKEFRRSDLLSTKDIQDILQNTDNIQFKCLLILMYESAARIEEIQNIRIKDITSFDSYISVFLRVSKTKQRSVPLIQSIPYISIWLNTHPLKEDLEAPFFINKYKNLYGKYSKPGLYLIILKIATCLNKKVWPHLFRHSRLTELAKHLTEAELCQFAGWKIGSRQVRRYVHLAYEDVENKILSMHGITPKKIPEKTLAIEVVKCPRCDYQNSNLDRFCSRCGSVLNIKTLLEHQEKAQELEQLIIKSEIKNSIEKIFKAHSIK